MRSEPLVDVHVHLYPTRSVGERAKGAYEIWEYGEDPGVHFSDAAGDLEGFQRTYTAAGFDHAVVLEFFDTASERRWLLERLAPDTSPAQRQAAEADADAVLAESLREANHWVVSTCRDDPLVSAFVCIDPTLLDAAAIRAHLREMAGAGARGVKLHPVAQAYRPSDARLDALYETCQDTGLVVLSHAGPGHRGAPGAPPSEFAAVMDRFPRLRLILAHLGGSSWSEAEAIAEAYPTVLFDVSEIIEWDGSAHAPSAETLAGVIRRIGAERVMLGSDYPWYDPAETADRVSALPGLSSAEVAAVLGGTAADALQLL